MKAEDATHVHGAKIALICGDRLVTYLRDDIAHIPEPGRWDLPGGMREEGETALDCVLRETWEEFGLHIAPETITHAALFVAPNPTRDVAFFAAPLPEERVREIVFGDEGQYWRMMPVDEFLSRTDAVEHLQEQVAALLGR